MIALVAFIFSVLALVAYGILVLDHSRLDRRVDRIEDVLRAYVGGLSEVEQQKLLNEVERRRKAHPK